MDFLVSRIDNILPLIVYIYWISRDIMFSNTFIYWIMQLKNKFFLRLNIGSIILIVVTRNWHWFCCVTRSWHVIILKLIRFLINYKSLLYHLPLIMIWDKGLSQKHNGRTLGTLMLICLLDWLSWSQSRRWSIVS